ncbi:MAG TPA: FAD-binding and (Fe-S)-binding domain-containing protein [Solirubrobacterales bacterium]|nr:FAD-binding and (Fe-S)-binding domain-containing protein [Solirubrobacterales bacterium]
MATALETRPLAQRSWTSGVDTRALALELMREVRGEVRFSPGGRALYANDASVYRQVPLGVVVPRREEDVPAALEICRRHGAPVGARGCGTGLAGQTVNEAVLFDFSKYMNRLLELDPERQFARVQPGVVLDDLREAAEEHELTFGPDPATHSRCTLGGMIGNNSCGVHSIMAGVTADNVEALDVVLYDGTRLLLPCRVSEDELEERIARGGREGEIYARLRDLRDRYGELVRGRYPQIPRRVSGYNLERLLPEHGFNVAAALVGTEATCALVLQAHLKLISSPQHRALVLIGYEDAPTAADHVPAIMEFGPIGLETFDRRLVDNELRKGFKRHPELLPDGDAWLLVEFGGDSAEEANGQAEEMIAAIEKRGGDQIDSKLYEDSKEIKQVWEIREGGEGNSKIPGVHPGWPSWEDAAVPPERTGEYLRDLEALCEKHGRRVSTFFGHAGHGCIHTRIDWDFLTPAGVANYRAFMEDAAELVCGKYNGSLSGEHGDGQARAELLDRMFGPELVEAFAEFKGIFDPEGKMNPGKVVHPYPLDTNLRVGPDYRRRELETQFGFPGDAGSFGNAIERCIGVGACRDQSGTMCPSYQVTLEEKHSTRGRARLLFEMMRSDSLPGGWRNEDVKEALDLCLACKGCKHECPVRVDMATYKAEFLSHYWQGRLRPRQAYALGLIPWEARLAARAPGLANFVLQREPLGRLARRAAGVAPQRRPPRFAARTFKSWFAERGRRRAPGRRVLLWGDTFNDHFHPEVAIAAVEGLEALGFEVAVPGGRLCCGRPLYDYGMLKLARRQLRRVLAALAPEIEAGTPLITLEPSCGAVFRDELVNLFPDDPEAKRLARMTTSLGEFLAAESERTELPRLDAKALVHLHCHQKATTDSDCDVAVLERLGVEPEVLDSGCCGLAGSFGYEAGEHYDVSIKAAERVLMPALRDADPGTLVVSDGFSCHSQIEHCGGEPPLHLAQVLQRALRSESPTSREAGGNHDE